MITTNYNDRPMDNLTTDDYDTLLVHLSEQVAACIRHSVDREEAHKAASDALANTWDESLTARGWLAAAGKRLDIDTSSCVGA